MGLNVTTTLICNLAMDEIPAARMDSINDNSVQAKACRNQYPMAVAEAMESTNWGFARTQAPLAEVTNDRDTQWAYAYAMPGNCALPIALVSVGSTVDGAAVPLAGQVVGAAAVWPGSPILYDYAGDVLYTNLAGAVLEYVIDDPTTAQFSAKFTRAIALTLAARTVMPIRNDSQRQAALEAKAEAFMQRAQANNRNRQANEYGDFVPEALRARMGE